jgi:hypothetical protein
MGRPKGIVRKIADETDLDQATVRRALAAADITEAQAAADLSKAVETVKAVADPARVIGHAANGRGEGGNNELTDTLAAARAHAERLRARKLEILNAKLEGELISRRAVTETGVHVIASVRTGLLALGYRVADKVAGRTDTREIARIVETEVRDVLGVLADPDAFLAKLEDEALT